MESKKVITVVLTFILYSCGGDNPAEPNNSDDLIPLALGNSWTYEVDFVDEENLRDQTQRIEYDTSIAGKTWYKLVGDSDETQMIHQIPFYRNREDGYSSMYIDSAGDKEILLLYKYPVEDGEEYKVKETVDVKILSTDKKINVNGKEWEVIVYETHSDQSEIIPYIIIKIKDYIRPGVGIIRKELFMYNQQDGDYDFSTRWELKEYDLN